MLERLGTRDTCLGSCQDDVSKFNFPVCRLDKTVSPTSQARVFIPPRTTAKTLVSAGHVGLQEFIAQGGEGKVSNYMFPHKNVTLHLQGAGHYVLFCTRNTCMQQPLALIGIQGTIFSEHEVFRVYDFDFEIVFIFTLSIFFKKCENNESIISFNYKLHNLHNFFS